jgi:hypothetical protein
MPSQAVFGFSGRRMTDTPPTEAMTSFPVPCEAVLDPRVASCQLFGAWMVRT